MQFFGEAYQCFRSLITHRPVSGKNNWIMCCFEQRACSRDLRWRRRVVVHHVDFQRSRAYGAGAASYLSGIAR